MQHCIRLAEPALAVVSERHAATLDRLDHGAPRVLTLGEEYERALASAAPHEPPDLAEPEDGLVILYTSGTTGMPKGALISQRAMVARGMISCVDISREAFAERGFVAWAPLFHMTATDYSMTTLTNGGKVVVMDRFDAGKLVEIIAREEIGYLTLMPGMIEQVSAELRRSGARRARSASSARWRTSCPATSSPRSPACCGRRSPTPLARPKPACRRRRPGACRSAPHRSRLPKTAECDWSLPPGRRGGPRRAGRRAGRARVARPDAVQRLLERARGQRGGFPRRLVPHGRRVRAQRRTARSISSTAANTSSSRAARTSIPAEIEQVLLATRTSPMPSWCAAPTRAGARCRSLLSSPRRAAD